MIFKIVIPVIYFALLIWIGAAASKKIHGLKDYFAANKSLGYWLVSFSSRATGESGWLLLGLTGMGFAVGLHSLWVVLGEVMGVAFCWILLTQRFKVFTDKYDSITIPDYFESRFRDTSRIIRIISTIVLVVFVTAYVSAQFTATGKAFESFLNIPYKQGVIIGLIIVLIYTVSGGFVAVVWSDLLQGVLMLAGLIVIPATALVKVGGITPLIHGIQNIKPDMLNIWGAGGFGIKGLLSALGLWSIGWAFLGSPQLFVRFLAVKDTRELINGSLVAVLFTILTDFGAIITGMCGRVIYIKLADAEYVLPRLTTDLFPAVITGFFIAVVLAAIMSTADSLLILASSAVVRDFYQKILHPEIPDEKLTKLCRGVTFILCIVALLFSIFKVRVIFWFVLFAWAGLGSVFCPILILSLFWKKLTRAGAIAGMIAGFITTLAWKALPVTFIYKILPSLRSIFRKCGFDDIKNLGDVLYEMVPAFFMAFFFAWIVSRFTNPVEGIDEDFRDVKSKVVDIWD